MNPVRALLIEDSPSDRAVILHSLRRNARAEFMARSHETLRDGLAAVAEDAFDIILLDLSLPDSYGLESLQRVMQTAPEVPVVVLSGMQDEQTAVEAVEQGAQDFLTKGRFESDLLVRSILYAIQRKRLELRLQRANDELEERVAERTRELEEMQHDARQREEELAHAARLTLLGEVMTGLAHELNQPLMSIVAFASTAQQLVDDKAPHQDLTEPLQRIQNGATLAGDIIRRLRRMVQRREPQTGELHMNNVVRNAMDFLRREIESRQVTIDLQLAKYLPPAMGDRVQLMQVVLNLVNNALQAIDRAGPRPDDLSHRVTLATRLEVSSGEIITSVSNTGPLISDEDRERLFDAFYTTRQEGLGLGLAISKSIVNSHGGQIRVRSADGEGMTFEFIIPTRVANASATPSAPSAEAPSSG